MDGGSRRRDRKTGPRRALVTLTAAQALGLSGAPMVFMVAGIVSGDLAPTAELASLPLAALVAGTALASAPAALCMRRLGRRRGFALGAVAGLAGALLASTAMIRESFAALTLGTMAIGASLAFVMQYRFAAAESVGPGQRERAVGWVMSGGVAAGLLGPELGMMGRHLLATPWAGSFMVLAGVQLALAALLLVGLDGSELPPERPTSRVARPGRLPVRRARDIRVAMAGGVTAYAVMTLLMTSTPFAMRVAGFDPDRTALVIQAHVVAMYLPSVFAGRLVAPFGARRLMAAGVVSMGGCVLLALRTHGLGSWVAALMLLGLGWNALFLGATIALADSERDDARFGTQALNESLVFGAQALASLAAGPLVAFAGWHVVNTVALGPLALMTLFMAARPRGGRPQPGARVRISRGRRPRCRPGALARRPRPRSGPPAPARIGHAGHRPGGWLDTDDVESREVAAPWEDPHLVARFARQLRARRTGFGGGILLEPPARRRRVEPGGVDRVLQGEALHLEPDHGPDQGRDDAPRARSTQDEDRVTVSKRDERRL